MQSLRTPSGLLVLLRGLLQSQKALRTAAQCQEDAHIPSRPYTLACCGTFT